MRIGINIRMKKPGGLSILQKALKLALNFLGANTLDPRITFTRASSATYFDSDGLMKTMGVNLLVQTTSFVTWAFTSASATSVSVAAPDGSATGRLYTASGSPAVIQSPPVAKMASALAHTATLYVKLDPTGTTALTLTIDDGTALNRGTVTFNPQTMVMGSVFNTGTFTATAGIAPVAVGNGWYRLGMTTTTDAGTTVRFRPFWTGTLPVTVWGPQLELGSTATTYFPTTTTSTSGPRLNYDPAVPAGTVGGELAPALIAANYIVTQPTAGSVTFTNGTLNIITTDASNGQAQQVGIVTPGKAYQCVITASAVSGLGCQIQLGISSNATNTSTAITTPGTYTFTLWALDNSIAIKRSFGGNSNSTITSFSVKEVTFAPRGLLIEEQRTNLLLHSRDMTQVVWGKADTTITRDQVGIDGAANSACLFTEGSANNAQTYQDATIMANQTVTQSLVVKKGNTNWVRCYMYDIASATDVLRGWFNLTTGTVGVKSQSGTASGVTTSMSPLGGGWYRCTVTGLVNATGTSIRFALLSASADGSFTRANNATYIVDAAQLEVGAFATSYTPTTTATATRAADSAVMTGSNFSDWYNQTEGTFVTEFDRFGFDGVAGSVVIVQADDGTPSNRVALRLSPRAASTTVQGTIVVGGVVGVNESPVITSDITNSVRKYGLAYRVGVGAVARDGLTPIALTSVASLPTVTQLQLGTGPSAVPLNGHIRSIRYYNTRLPDATLQALTA